MTRGKLRRVNDEGGCIVRDDDRGEGGAFSWHISVVSLSATIESMAMETNEIEPLRKQLDGLDEKLVDLLNQRANLSLSISVLKQDQNLPRYDAAREERIFDHIQEVSTGPLIGAPLREIYETILRVMKEL